MIDRPHNTRNNIGPLRLVLASAVIVGHAPELVDGTRLREPLTKIFGTLSLGEVSVDAFFVLSGFLITQSLTRQSSFAEFVSRRMLRIYPAFLIASLLSIFGFGAIFHVHTAPLFWPAMESMALLRPPYMAHALDGLPYPSINGAMWTIAYEFRCYLFAFLLCRLGVFQRPPIAVAITALVMTAFVLSGLPMVHAVFVRLSGNPLVTFVTITPLPMIRFVAAFLVGTSVNLYSAAILERLTGRAALLGGLVAIMALAGSPLTAEAGLLIGGSVVLFRLAFRSSIGVLRHVNENWDISYGTYLYGWPIATTLIWMDPEISPWLVGCVTLPLAWGMGAVSWWGIERPILVWRQNLPKARSVSTHSVAFS